MSKKDLGLVGVYPWTDLSELYTFPASSFYDYEGGYKVVNGICWVDVTIIGKGSASVTLPAIKSKGKNHCNIYRNATDIIVSLMNPATNGKLLTSNVVKIVKGDYITIYGYYDTTAANT